MPPRLDVGVARAPARARAVPPAAARGPELAAARALGAAVAYGRAARALRASPHTLSRLVRTAPAADDAMRRACVWTALAAYFGGPRPS